ncbi:MAG: hypothetical protein ACTHNU_10110 [Gaiellales bacterium]
MRPWLARQDRVLWFGFAVFLLGVVTRVQVLLIAGLVLEVVGLFRSIGQRRRGR